MPADRASVRTDEDTGGEGLIVASLIGAARRCTGF